MLGFELLFESRLLKREREIKVGAKRKRERGREGKKKRKREITTLHCLRNVKMSDCVRWDRVVERECVCERERNKETKKEREGECVCV